MFHLIIGAESLESKVAGCSISIDLETLLARNKLRVETRACMSKIGLSWQSLILVSVAGAQARNFKVPRTIDHKYVRVLFDFWRQGIVGLG